MVRHGWPYFGLTTTLNAAAYCASMSTVSAGQQRNGQVAGTRHTVYGSDAVRWHHGQVGLDGALARSRQSVQQIGTATHARYGCRWAAVRVRIELHR